MQQHFRKKHNPNQESNKTADASPKISYFPRARQYVKNKRRYKQNGTEKQLANKRKYSFSDRCRYYFALPEMKEAVGKLFRNLDETEIPLSMLRQYMPVQYVKVRDGILPRTARELAEDCVVHLIEDYNYATKLNYMTGDVFCC